MSGKWHILPSNPKSLGFQRADTMTDSGTSYFYPFDRSGSTKAGQKKTPAEEAISKATYVTDWYADGVCNYLDETAKTKQPFLIYWTPTAPHYPLQCKQVDLDQQKGKYAAGPKAIAEARYKKMTDLGIVDPAWPYILPEIVAKPDLAWSTDVRTDADPWPPPADYQFANNKNKEMGCARRSRDFSELMEIYAAQVSSMDQQVGKVVDKLKSTGRYNNTLILFCSDNGASNEKQSTGNAWAQVSNTPFPRYKRYNDGGGNRTSAILHWPDRIAPKLRGSLNRSYAHVIDILPTVADAASAPLPTKDKKGNDLPAFPGRSLLPILAGETLKLKQPLFFEHDGNLAVVTDEWKLVSTTREKWRLYDLQADPLEQHNLAAEKPEIVKQLATHWQAWAEANFARPGGDDRKGKDRLDPTTLQP